MRCVIFLFLAHVVSSFRLIFLHFLVFSHGFALTFGILSPDSEPIHFPGSRIILNNATWGAAVNTWAGTPAAQVWSLCYSSLTDNHDTPYTFHELCDPHSITVVFARNSIGNVFGGYVRCAFRLFFSPFCCCFVLICCSLFAPFHLSLWVDFRVN